MEAGEQVFEGTVASGLERMAVEEVKEKFSTVLSAKFDRGHVFFTLPLCVQLKEVLALRSFNHVSVVMFDQNQLDIHTDKAVALENIKRLVHLANWDQGLKVWRSLYAAGRGAPESGEEFMPKFRVTCSRTGMQHAFGSPDAASVFGAAVVEKFGWPVNLDNFDVEVLLTIDQTRVRIALALTNQSLAMRNVVSCGPTTMKATIAYGLLRLCRLRDHEVVCDPMCGSGSIILEAIHSWPNCCYLAGDIWEQNVNICKKNLTSLLATATQKVNVQLFCWDATKLPLRDAMVDCFITDLPYGKRSGSKAQNTTLYPAFLREVSRVLRPHGRACIVSMTKGINRYLNNTRLRYQKSISINLGGIYPTATILTRAP